jgi:hypothetical protein
MVSARRAGAQRLAAQAAQRNLLNAVGDRSDQGGARAPPCRHPFVGPPSRSPVGSGFDRVSRYANRPVASLLRVTSRPAWRRPVKAARTACGNRPRRCPISATEAPSGRSSMPISCARLVFARDRFSPDTLAVVKSPLCDGGADCEARGSGEGGVFVASSIRSEALLEAAGVDPAAELVWVTADLDRGGVRGRGARLR